MFISREITGQVETDRAYENAERGEKRFEGRILGTVTFRRWERAEELVRSQKRNFRGGGREVGRCNVMEIKKGDISRRRGGAAAKCAEVEKKKY